MRNLGVFFDENIIKYSSEPKPSDVLPFLLPAPGKSHEVPNVLWKDAEESISSESLTCLLGLLQ